MKSIILLLLMVAALSSCVSSRIGIDSLADAQASGEVQLKRVKLPMLIAKPIIKHQLRQDEDSEGFAQFVGRFKKLKLVTGTVSSPQLVAKVIDGERARNLQEWVSVRSNGKRVFLGAYQKRDVIRRFTLVAAQQNGSFTYASIKCKLSVEQLSKLLSTALSDGKLNDLTNSLTVN